jgi:agmatine/peptidylarginine deiminase
MHVPPNRQRLLQLVVIVAVAAAAFQAGRLWQQRLTPPAAPPTPPQAPTPPSRSPIIPKNVRAEFNPQSALLIGANELIRFHQPVFKDVVRTIHTRIPVMGIINDDDDLDLGRELLAEAGLPEDAVHFIRHPLDSMWLRDYGPIFSRWTDGRVRIIDATYDNPDNLGARTRDDAFPAYLARVLGLELDRMPLIIEGGNLLSNGDGLMVTSTRVIRRVENQVHSVQNIGALLQNHLGCRVWAYLRELEGEPTGHADFFMTFLRRNLAVVARLDPAVDATNAAILDEAAATLARQSTSMGPMLVERIPMPPPTADGFWRSYNNVLLVNGIILIPSYSDVDPALEAEARATYERLMPSWTVVSIKADSLVKKNGVLHCIGIGIPGYVNVQPLIDQAAD